MVIASIVEKYKYPVSRERFREFVFQFLRNEEFLEIINHFRYLREKQDFEEAQDFVRDLKPIIDKELSECEDGVKLAENIYSGVVILFSVFSPDEVKNISLVDFYFPIDRYDKHMRLSRGYPPVFK